MGKTYDYIGCVHILPFVTKSKASLMNSYFILKQELPGVTNVI